MPIRGAVLDVRIPAARMDRAVQEGAAQFLRSVLERRGAVLQVLGELLKSISDDAFKLQRFGDVEWPERYPAQSEPFINIAAVVEQLGAGRRDLLPRFFSRRPALLGTGHLRRSVQHTIEGENVRIGSPLPYAGVHQWGGETVQPITQEIKTALAAIMRAARRRQKRRKKKGEAKDARAAKRDQAIQKLGFLFRRTELKTQIAPRPFFGVPNVPNVKERIIREVEDILNLGLREGQGR